MVASKSARSKARKGLTHLINTARPTGDDLPGDVFGFNILTWKSSGPNDDRAMAIVLATVVDQGLEAAIATKFVNHDNQLIFNGESAPLRDMDAKVRIAFALGSKPNQALALAA